MFSLVHDFNGDGWLDILVLGRVHVHQAYWYQNPGPPGKELWKKHFVADRVKGESPTLVDINRDGRAELITHDERQWGWLEPDPETSRKALEVPGDHQTGKMEPMVSRRPAWAMSTATAGSIWS